MSWRLVYTKQARKDARKLAAAGLKPKAQELLAVLGADPFQSPPPFEKLVGDLSGAYSRRINIQLMRQALIKTRRKAVMTESKDPKRSAGAVVGALIGVGAGVGLVVGILLGSIALGLVFGAALGAVAGAVVEANRRKQ